MKLIQNQSLQSYNTFGVPAMARYFAPIGDSSVLEEMIRGKKFEYLPKLVIGGGSNILFVKDFGGIVFHMEIPGIEIVREDDTHVWVRSGSGTVWHNLVLFAVERGLHGIENLSLIPGQVGAAPIQNIGAYGVELKDVFESLEAISLETGEIRIFTSKECGFGYRESIFKRKLKGIYAITYVTLRLNKRPNFNIEYKGIKEMLTEMRVDMDKITARDISNAVIRIRTRKLPDPAKIGNAGSFFKNPEIPAEEYENLKNQYPDIPGYPVSESSIKIPTAWLIEQSGWKGITRERVGTYEKQPLVLVNRGGATGKEIYALSEEIMKSVNEKFGIKLDREVNIY